MAGRVNQGRERFCVIGTWGKTFKHQYVYINILMLNRWREKGKRGVARPGSRVINIRDPSGARQVSSGVRGGSHGEQVNAWWGKVKGSVNKILLR